MEAFKVAGNFFFQLWKVFAKDVVSATLDLTLLFAAQASELELKQQLNNNEASYALQQHRCSQHNIHLEKASVLFNLGALCTHIALSCDLTTIQGHRLAMDALIDASNWFYLLRFESKKASGTIDLSESYAIAIANRILGFTLNFPPHPQSICASAYVPSTFGLLAENLVQSSTPQYLEYLKSKMKTCHIETGPSDVTEQFLLGYCKSHALLQEVRGVSTTMLGPSL
ncbi:uncharacterized protein LOC130951983 [Arachis stenosperma]|uniref:uncharacterized protein LOC130951983 n=1 Tax=Arachis stenosperma TaxID=217475 RepID=UPI0025AD34FB|nr:uncharacterized protein LOC130951983 [Arachis stenosperma]